MGVAIALLSPRALAWWPQGHSILGEAAVRSLPAEIPAFFRAGGGLIAHCTQDPDVAKNRDAPFVNDQEFPEHFLDWEFLRGEPLPLSRHEYLKLCNRLNLDPKVVGYLPYSVAEWTERLAVALAEHRKYPDNPHIQTKCLVYAGFLAHYAADLCMPLHVTKDYDGRANPDGSSPHTGIHAKVDSLIEKLAMKPNELAKNQKIEPLGELLPGVIREMERSRALIDRTYELEPLLPPQQGSPQEGAWKPAPEIVAFTTERARAATRFTAALYLTAWRKSATIKLPFWLQRESSSAPSARPVATPATSKSTTKLLKGRPPVSKPSAFKPPAAKTSRGKKQ